jgi:hypothetical protein
MVTLPLFSVPKRLLYGKFFPVVMTLGFPGSAIEGLGAPANEATAATGKTALNILLLPILDKKPSPSLYNSASFPGILPLKNNKRGV